MEATQYLVPVYAVYAATAVGLTIWLARTLFRNGAVFLHDVFEDKRDLADAVNRLLVVGFYLFNLGYAALLLRADPAESVVGAIETLAFKLGLLSLSLGVMHFANMVVFHRIRRRTLEEKSVSAYRTHGHALPDGRRGEGLDASAPHSAFALIERDKTRQDGAWHQTAPQR